MNEQRRKMLRLLGAAGAAGIFGMPSRSAYAEPPPETTRLRIGKVRSVCLAPQYVAEELLRAEGFTEIEYIGEGPVGAGGVPGAQALGAGAIDFAMNFAAPLTVALDMGAPIVLLAGVHVGCFELVVSEKVALAGGSHVSHGSVVESSELCAILPAGATKVSDLSPQLTGGP